MFNKCLIMPNQFFRQNHSITLEQIKNFICVYELESISLSANVLHKTQPAISHSITQLEQKLHTKLVKRNRGKTTSFTEEGHNFYRKVKPLINQLLIQIDEIENKQTVSIGLCDDLSVDIQMDIYDRVNQKTTNRIRLLCDFSCKIKEMVADGRLSFAIIKKVVNHDKNKANTFHWVANKEINFHNEQKIAVVSAHQGCFLRNILEQSLQKANKNFYFTYIANNLASQAEAVNAGFGIGLLDNHWINKYPNLIILDKKHGFPQLPSFEYECIGEADTANKKNIHYILKDIIELLNNRSIY